ncbi:MAG: DNA repair protein RadA [Eubacteriales bacterium]|nr:DNA repair protein RadA [Eubacteriales bacterium]
MAGNLFFCTECGYESRGWLGKCPACGVWNSFAEAPQQEKEKKQKKNSRSSGAWLDLAADDVLDLAEVDAREVTKIETGISELDLVLGGGLVPGSLILLGGEPGVGKSTLLLQILNQLEEQKPGSVLYVSGEESPGQIKLRADRLGIPAQQVKLLASTDLADFARAVEKLKPEFCLIDSIQTLYSADLTSAPGSASQLREVTAALLRLAKAENICMIIAGHVTKDGQIAGPRILEHMVDTVLYFEGEKDSYYRLLRAHKNRFGSVDELGIFDLDDKGLHSLANPSAQLLAGRPQDVPGTALTVGLEGSRPMVMEIQALVSPSNYQQALRMTEGFERNRLSLLLALLAHSTEVNLALHDVYLNVTGGLRLRERSADLAVVAAALSSLERKALPQNLIILGELGLAGELRRVPDLDKRVMEALKLGFRRFIVPSQSESMLAKLKLKENPEFFYASLLSEAIDWMFP